MSTSTEDAREWFDRLMVEATGHTHEQYELLRHAPHTNLEHVKLYGRIVDESGCVDALERWADERRKSNAGRKPLMSFRTVLILFVMHLDSDSDQRCNNIAKTLFAQTTPETRAYLGLPRLRLTKRQWYCRYWRALNRMLSLVEPWDVPKNRAATAEEYQRALETYSQVKRDRMDEIMNRLVQTTVRRLPDEIRATYKGNVAIDATLLQVVGEANPNRANTHLDRLNLDSMSGRYRRGGNHEGTGAKKDSAGWEVETIVTVPNAPGQPDSFPILTTALTMHQPGRTKHGPRVALEHHCREFGEHERGYLLADRLYSDGSKPERFQKHVMRMRFRTVFDYKIKKSGKNAAIDDVIFVGGRPYVKWMPEALITAQQDYKAGLIDKDTCEARIAGRTPYALKDHGRPDHEGRQRFTYPDLSKVMCIDPATKKVVKPKLTKKTFTLAPEDAASMRAIKYLQGFEHKSTEWRAWYGLRSHVESNNQYVKSDAATDLGNPEKRRPRGYAYQALSAAVAFAVSNLRRIVSFIEAKFEAATDDTPKKRQRRRTDEHGVPLPH